MYILRIAPILFLLALPLPGQTAAELLQKGIYTQETVGDIDAAIRIYQQVVALGAEGRNHAAQAQYRLGMCLLRKGSTAEASKAFEKLIADYPEQKELVAAARQQIPEGLKLLAAPWIEGEMLKLKLKMPTGLAIGMWVQSIEKSQGGTLVVKSRTHAGGANQFSRAEADLDTLRPRSTYFRQTMIGESRVAYSGRQAQVQVSGKPAKTTELSQTTFDNELAIPLFRRLPLAEGYSAKFDILSPLGSAIPITAVVTAIEDVETAAGKFRAFKVEAQPIGQTFWISNDARRYLVKMEMNGITGELEEVGRLDSQATTYRDATQNVSIAVASPWLMMRDETNHSKTNSTAMIMDPEAKCHCGMWAGAIEKDLRAEMEEKVKQRATGMKGYTVRPDSWRTRQIGGQEALTVIADYDNNKVPTVESITLIKQANRGMVLFARIPAADYAALQPQFDVIVESARLQ